MNVVVIHYSEIGTKGKNRSFFENRLVRNIQKALGERVDGVYKRYGVIICDYVGGIEEISNILKMVPGIANFSFGQKVDLDYGKIKDGAIRILQGNDFGSFRVTCKRSNKNFFKKSDEINIEIGELIREKFGKKVDLDNPNLELFIEIGEKEAFLYCEKFKGLGGLPIGVSGKIITSLSGGIDSPVAAYLMMRRGCNVVPVHFYNNTVSGEATLNKIEKIVKVLGKIQSGIKLYIVRFEKLQKEIIKNVPADKRMIIYRRYMMKILNEIALKESAKGIVTGDSVGQVASQTLENLDLIFKESKVNVFSPLISMNKEEIIEIARKIKTYDFSILPYDDCCSFMIAKHPETKGKLEEIERSEGEIDNSLVEEAVEEVDVRKF